MEFFMTMNPPQVDPQEPTRWSRSLTTAEYVAGLAAIDPHMTPLQRRLLVAQYHAPDRQVTSPQLAQLVGIKSQTVNLEYGNLGRLFCDQTGELPDVRTSGRDIGKDRLWTTWSVGWQSADGFVWQMLPQVAVALEQLGWVQPKDFRSPDEVSDVGSLVEGAVRRITVNAYERNTEARRLCILTHGTACCICGFSFGAEYGSDVEGYIHVHHLRPLSEIGGEYIVDPVEDLRPVCPNCHAVLHLGGCRSIEDVQRLRTQQRQRSTLQ